MMRFFVLVSAVLFILAGAGDSVGQEKPSRSISDAGVWKILDRFRSLRPADKDLPDLKAIGVDVPAGVRLFVRLADEKAPRSKIPVVEVVAMKPEEWKVLSYPDQSKDIDAAALKSWLVQLCPASIRKAADQQQPFTKITGSLKLQPAGVDRTFRYALLQGKIRLANDDGKESAFEGTIQAVLTYAPTSSNIKSIRGVVDGESRIRGTQRSPMVVVIESRPE